MTRRATIGTAVAVALLAIAALGFSFSRRFQLAVLNPAELALKKLPPPSPPDDSGSRVQSTLADSASGGVKRQDDPLNDDELAIYKAVIERWNTKSRKPLNVSDKTMPLNHSISDCECLKGI